MADKIHTNRLQCAQHSLSRVYKGTDLPLVLSPFSHPMRQQLTFSLSSKCQVRCTFIFIFVEELQRSSINSSSMVKGYSEDFEVKFGGSVPLRRILTGGRGGLTQQAH